MPEGSVHTVAEQPACEAHARQADQRHRPELVQQCGGGRAFEKELAQDNELG